MKIAHVNQDRGIAPHEKKGAAIHLSVLRRAFAECGAAVRALDVPDPVRLAAALEAEHAIAPFDLVYERHARGALAGGEFARRRGVPLVLEVNAPLALEDELYRGRSAGADAGERALFASAARVLAVTPEVARYAVERGAAAERVVVCPNAVDSDRFRPRAADDPLRRALVPRGRFALGFHGRLRPWHNFALLVDAFALLLARGTDAHIVVVGEGAFEAHFAARVPVERVTLVGWKPHDETARHVACFDALALTYAADRPFYYSPLKLLEAMAVRAVPVVPRLSTLPEIVGEGTRGLVYPAGDAHALADALALLARDPERASRMADAARAYAEERSWRAVAEDVLQFISDVRA